MSPRLTGRQKPGIEIVVDIFCNFKYFKTEIRIKTNTMIIRIHECNPLSFQLWKKRWGGGEEGEKVVKIGLKLSAGRVVVKAELPTETTR